jgi:hypothetical protein
MSPAGCHLVEITSAELVTDRPSRNNNQLADKLLFFKIALRLTYIFKPVRAG